MSDSNESEVLESVKPGDTWEYNSGVRVDVKSIICEPHKNTYRVRADIYHREDLVDRKTVEYWHLNLNSNDVTLIHRKPPRPNIVNPIWYPDYPETPEECERAFEITRNMCRSMG